MDIDDEDEIDDEKCKVCITASKKVATFVLSHVGLITLVVGYCLIGAVIFEALESEHERQIKANMVKVRELVSQDLWTMTKETEIIRPDRWAENASKRLQEFETELLKAIKKKGWDGSENQDQLQWTFTGSLFYSIITITTIGYGHIAPKTVWGKIVTIFYAIIGIPLMVLCWSHLGDFMANSFRFIYWRVCCYLCTRKPKRRRGPMRRGRSMRGPPSRGPGSVRVRKSIRRSARISQRSADSAISDSVISTNSDPIAGTVPETRHQEHEIIQMTPRGRPAHPHHHPHRHSQVHLPKRSTKSAEPELRPNLPVLYNKYADEMMQMGSGEEPKAKPVTITRNRNRSVPPEAERYISQRELSRQDIEYWYDDEDDFDSDYEEDIPVKRPVPIWLCSGIVIAYIVGGAFLFSSWEQWKFLDSAYFCFITLSTIGFGDFVPTQESETGIALCSLYLLIGIALLAMSFNLVQEQVITAVKKVAITLGILDDEEDVY